MSAYGTYGAVELKKVVQRYMFLGLAISITIHLGAISSLRLNLFSGDLQSIGNGHPTTSIPILINDHPKIPGIYTPPVGKMIAGASTGVKGVPVPVKEELTGRTTATQEELRESVEPTEESGGFGSRIEPVRPIEEELPPEPFVAVQRDPVIISRVLPDYPVVAIQAQLEGKVWVRIWVDRQGRARKAEIIKSNNDIFNDAALAAARQFVFTPAYMRNGPVSVWVAVPFTFTLKNPGE